MSLRKNCGSRCSFQLLSPAKKASHKKAPLTSRNMVRSEVISRVETKCIVSKRITELNRDAIFHFLEFNQNPVKLTYKS